MKILIATDSFKGSLSSLEAGHSIAAGIHRVNSNIETIILPLADGGEGTVEALTSGMNGAIKKVYVTGPLGKPVLAEYGILKPSQTAVIQISSAAGLPLVPQEERNPLYTTTYGVGEIIKDAILKGCRNFIVGLGGSATNDGGIGMLQALGYEFLDKNGTQLPFGAYSLANLTTIRNAQVLPQLKDCHFRVACDVSNELCGKNGCSYVFAPQKGATPTAIKQMDEWLQHYTTLSQGLYPNANPHFPGCGAAGGLGFAFLTYMHATLESGVQIVIEETHIEDSIKNTDIVITGEGRLDFQSAMGKAPIGVAKLAKKYHKPVLAFAGSIAKDASISNQEFIDAFFPILREVTSLDEAMQPEQAKENLMDTAEQVFRLLFLKY